jgi:hypothetical protein
MWEKSNHCYSEKDMLKMLKSASIEQLTEFLLKITRRSEDGK